MILDSIFQEQVNQRMEIGKQILTEIDLKVKQCNVSYGRQVTPLTSHCNI
jgi:hypothetical protein